MGKKQLSKLRISLSPSSIVTLLSTVTVILIVLSIGGQLIEYLTDYNNTFVFTQLFFVDAESNIPTLFSVLLLLISAVLLALIAYFKTQQSTELQYYWSILSFGFFFMVIDEMCQMHEQLVMPVRNLMGSQQIGILHYAWVIPGLIVVLLIGIYFLQFLKKLPQKTRNRFLLAGFIYICGVIGIELLGGWYAFENTELNFKYTMISTIEESLEMAGIIIFVWALLKYIENHFSQVKVVFGDVQLNE